MLHDEWLLDWKWQPLFSQLLHFPGSSGGEEEKINPITSYLASWLWMKENWNLLQTYFYQLSPEPLGALHSVNVASDSGLKCSKRLTGFVEVQSPRGRV